MSYNETSYRRIKVKNTDYNDQESRNAMIQFAKDVLNINVESNPKKTKIDLIGVDDPTIGIEIEHGEWKGNYWDPKNVGYNTKSSKGFMTVNIPWWRKYIYWTEGIDPNYNTNLFLRCNDDFTCVILIRPETIRDRKKALDDSFKTKKIGTGEIESWKVFRKEHVETYNKIDGVWIKT